MARLVIVSNRVASPTGREARAGGLAIAMRDALGTYGGIWFGWSGDISQASSEAPDIRIVDNRTYATIDLSQEDYDQYYQGYANATLWPLLHFRLGLVEYRQRNFDGYLRVNALFARLLRPLLRRGDLIWVHDYHLIPLASELRKLGVQEAIGFFLHTPFPPLEVLSALPCHEKLLAGFDGYDLVGFQTEEAANAFAALGSRVRMQGGLVARSRGAWPHVGVFPIGIDPDRFAQAARRADSSADTKRLVGSLGGRRLIIGVDRLDYSKGIPNRFDAVGRLLKKSPGQRGKFSYLQITPHSRGEVKPYAALRRQLEAAAGRINGRFAAFDWTPIRYVNRSFTRQSLAGFYRHAAIGLVTPMRDGMNLVAKEYVVAQDESDPGVLILSSLAGAARELDAALLVNPLNIDEIVTALGRGLSMGIGERRERWQSMIAAIRGNTIAIWRDRFIEALRTARRRRARPRRAGLPQRDSEPVGVTKVGGV